jgi:hypothetical protein
VLFTCPTKSIFIRQLADQIPSVRQVLHFSFCIFHFAFFILHFAPKGSLWLILHFAPKGSLWLIFHCEYEESSQRIFIKF